MAVVADMEINTAEIDMAAEIDPAAMMTAAMAITAMITATIITQTMITTGAVVPHPVMITTVITLGTICICIHVLMQERVRLRT